MTQLERRQARIRRMKQKLQSTRPPPEHIATDPDACYHIGASQNRHQHIGTFLLENEGDPAIKVGIFLSYLNLPHLLLELST